MKWEKLENIIQRLKLRSRAKLHNAAEVSIWSDLFFIPLDGYVEFSWGPVSVEEIEWLEIEFVKEVSLGARLKPRLENHLSELENFFKDHSIVFKVSENQQSIFLPISNAKIG